MLSLKHLSELGTTVSHEWLLVHLNLKPLILVKKLLLYSVHDILFLAHKRLWIWLLHLLVVLLLLDELVARHRATKVRLMRQCVLTSNA